MYQEFRLKAGLYGWKGIPQRDFFFHSFIQFSPVSLRGRCKLFLLAKAQAHFLLSIFSPVHWLPADTGPPGASGVQGDHKTGPCVDRAVSGTTTSRGISTMSECLAMAFCRRCCLTLLSAQICCQHCGEECHKARECGTRFLILGQQKLFFFWCCFF